MAKAAASSLCAVCASRTSAPVSFEASLHEAVHDDAPGQGGVDGDEGVRVELGPGDGGDGQGGHLTGQTGWLAWLCVQNHGQTEISFNIFMILLCHISTSVRKESGVLLILSFENKMMEVNNHNR